MLIETFILSKVGILRVCLYCNEFLFLVLFGYYSFWFAEEFLDLVKDIFLGLDILGKEGVGGFFLK